MEIYSNSALQQFRNLVGIRFQLYNSLFTSLPFHRIEKTGVLLSLFLIHCEEGFLKKQSPIEIVDSFLSQYTSYKKEQEFIDLLFRFIQYTERQVVLFDALEDAAFKHVNDINGPGTLKHLQSEVSQTQKKEELSEKLKDFSVRLVLTAHPTQFYPGEVLGIINDLSEALVEENAAMINMYLQQLGKTPFLKKQKPTPYDEAVSLLWFLENVFYQAAGAILMTMKDQYGDSIQTKNPVIRMGFWPGGDRDGNPFVTADITLKVADALRNGILRSYYFSVRRLKRRLTFKGVEERCMELEKKLYDNLFVPGHKANISQKEILHTLLTARKILIEQHNGLFLHLLDNVISKVEIFGLFFASLDLRQDSTIHGKVLDTIATLSNILPPGYTDMSDEEKIAVLQNINAAMPIEVLENELYKDTILSMQAAKSIQKTNGEQGCNRYIISQCNSALNVMEVFGLFMLSGWDAEELTIDIIPLFETIDDLENAAGVMRILYENKVYRNHLQKRGNTQTIMLGFSDGTKDGGYLMANWGIYKAKQELTRISKQYDLDVIFFDGRGGPPARGGGKTHKFYASMGKDISNKEIQLTVQGQTVSSSFGTIEAAQFNIEQLIHAGITNELFSTKEITLNKEEEELLQTLADNSYKAYIDLKEHPYFVEYLAQVSPLRFYAETNIGSRPAKRGGSAKLTLKDLRAIPYVGAWSQLKQNVTGYYGVGTALKKMEEAGKWKQVQKLYKESLFFKTLIDNCEMAMKKSYFPLTEYLSQHPKYGEIWSKTYHEYELSIRYVLKLSGNHELMADYPVDQLSISMRERIVLPLVTIQQYALSKVRNMEEQLIQTPIKDTYGKLAMRCSFGIINAGRNSA
ncbi:phosphoenolpyruvate carboxylase [Panacibacter ginsenosidivorans]|uniref:Phosphoenolpyruvate carboxylase n=1 Tax=Panacibacter ginsenosidivorans TaxID=1813871 RepID=A0A5B8V487_9BACT|nr:phosphoenolpyruvate carboxylase [Panacibacter ginsenosidivorans]QEC66190.1 phosphoenolpyruvate carboxylase [Panacibacter ginsenosidivorans]